MNCIKCGRDFTTTATTGRPPSYCSTACRRAAEMEITRINRRLEALEDELITYKKWGKGRDSAGRTGPELLELQQGIIAETEARLRELLDAQL
ncbi:hypothetical protein [Methylomicrobium sp. Wu6]|uniref:hypothetical protein n=1 Tax=Methylomicrobium sp. Wu6 TaxID=3107928 RepID=UPI002DD64ACF|nr:hypothetical protein [Methylomicrobium sp. Wu6]MEC4747959.1 hypothetical protein [Methylomicrobium sp. Wu6]